MFVDENFRTKKALRDAITDGELILLDNEFITEGEVTIEAQQPYSWRARVKVEAGQVVKVIN